MERPFALVADPDPGVRARVCGALTLRERAALEVERAADVPRLVREHPVELLIADTGCRQLLEAEPLDGAQAPVVVALAGPGDHALELIRAGAFDVLLKPLDEAALEAVVERAVRHCGLLRDLRRTRARLRSQEGSSAIVGHSPGIERLREQLQRLAGVACDVWISGEPGTGKELVAHTLHELSPVTGAFGVVRCAALGAPSWEAQWHGAGRTGPSPLRDQVAGGTLYLEDFTELQPELQLQLLRTLGRDGSRPRSAHSDLRVVFSSTRDPARAVDDGRLAQEAWRALGCETMALPPLRERPGDVALLARHFVATICQLNNLAEISLTPEVGALLERYPWPENVRELRNAIEQAVILSRAGRVRPEDLPERIRGAPPAGRSAAGASERELRAFRAAKREVVSRFERDYLAELMRRHAGNVTSAAQQAGMLRSALQRLLRKCGLRSMDFRDPNDPAPDGGRRRGD